MPFSSTPVAAGHRCVAALSLLASRRVGVVLLLPLSAVAVAAAAVAAVAVAAAAVAAAAAAAAAAVVVALVRPANGLFYD